MQEEMSPKNPGPQVEDGPDNTKRVLLTKQDIALVLRSDGEKYWVFILEPKDPDDKLHFIRQMIYGAAGLAADDPDLLFESAFVKALTELRKTTGSSLGPDDPATEEEIRMLSGESYSEDDLKLLTTKIEGNA